MSDNIYFNGITLLEPDKDESDEFALYNIPTQQLVFQKEQTNNRFAEPVSESQINQRIKDRVPKNTKKANTWAF
jgi:Cu2+-containing amine oxidase